MTDIDGYGALAKIMSRSLVGLSQTKAAETRRQLLKKTIDGSAPVGEIVIENERGYTAWATVFDPLFRLRYALRDKKVYEDSRKELLGHQKGLSEFSDEYWVNMGVEWWLRVGSAKAFGDHIAEDFAKWRNDGSPLPPEHCISSNEQIESMLKSGTFWDERARWGDDVEGFVSHMTDSDYIKG